MWFLSTPSRYAIGLPGPLHVYINFHKELNAIPAQGTLQTFLCLVERLKVPEQLNVLNLLRNKFSKKPALNRNGDAETRFLIYYIYSRIYLFGPVMGYKDDAVL